MPAQRVHPFLGDATGLALILESVDKGGERAGDRCGRVGVGAQIDRLHHTIGVRMRGAQAP